MRIILLLVSWAVVAACTQISSSSIPQPTAIRNAIIVTDIDGTLTPKNIAVFEVRPGAVEALQAMAGKGYQIVYLTARTPLLQSGLPDWLHRHGFPPGPLHVAQTAQQRKHPDQYKAQVLADYIKAGWRLAYGFGDSSSDFAAYAAAHIPQAHVFALLRQGDSECQPGLYQRCLKSWLEYQPYIKNTMPSLSQ